MSHTKIHIAKPCHENWLQMKPDDKGRFCDSCQKKVHDFTASSDRKILEIFRSEKNICGRFTHSQLNRELTIQKQRSTIWAAGIAGILSLFNFGNNEVYAQKKTETIQTDNYNSKGIMGKMAIPDETIISGKVSEGNYPLPAAAVQVKGSNTQTETDTDGNFQIRAKENDILVFSFIGMEVLEVRVGTAKKLSIEMKNADIKMGETVITSRERTLFGRIFHKIDRFFTLKWRP